MKIVRTSRVDVALGLAAISASLFIASEAQAQQPPPLPPTNQEIFAPLDLPNPNGMRLGSGRPGPDYWQQGVEYRIQASLDPAQHRVTGSETIEYTNNSPDELNFIWIQLEQNLFAPGSRGSLINSGNRWRGAFSQGGADVTRVEVIQDGQRATAATMTDDTRMRVDLPEPLRPGGGVVQIEIDWTFVIPEYGADRMGRMEGQDGWVYELAQWYPRVYVYDELEGWNPMPYLGQGEFYLEYGSFDVEITAPRDFLVVGSGKLLNPGETWPEEQRRRLDRAATSSETVAIVSPDEVGDDDVRPDGRGPVTWRFRIENARDFAWAASKGFILDAASWDGTLLMSAYPKEGLGDEENPGWEMSTQYLRHTIEHYSDMWFRYPYPVAINVAGVVGGMEYPGIVFCGVRARGQGLFGVTDHEFGHTWFPMIVGSDERRNAWMDEGFNTFINHYSNLEYYGSESSRASRTSGPFIASRMAQPFADQPIMTQPDVLRGASLGFFAYRKPGFGLVMLREFILGEERFDAAFKQYIDDWAYKHPKPYDFFRTIEEVSGEELSWFWRGWFLGTDVLDQAVVGVDSDENGVNIHLENREGLVMPVDLLIELEGGQTIRQKLPVEIWMRGDSYTFTIAPDQTVISVVIDPDGFLPDQNVENNRWTAPPVS